MSEPIFSLNNPAFEEELKTLRLKHWKTWIEGEMTSLLPNEQGTLLRVLQKCVKQEIVERKNSQIEGKIKSAKFKNIQTVDQFNFAFSKYTQTVHKPYLSFFNSITDQNLPSAVFSGTPGTGKTHLARALGYRCCQLGLSVSFVRVSDMVNHLVHAQKIFHLDQELVKYRRPQVLIMDELGYVSLDSHASNLFFQVVSARHDLGLGTIATTNLAFGKFNQIFANDAIAHAIVDRLVNEAEVFFMEGPSYREHQRQEKIKNRK
jgi:DNA replication protein DnaC